MVRGSLLIGPSLLRRQLTSIFRAASADQSVASTHRVEPVDRVREPVPASSADAAATITSGPRLLNGRPGCREQVPAGRRMAHFLDEEDRVSVETPSVDREVAQWWAGRCRA